MRIIVKFKNRSYTKYYEDVYTYYIKKEQDKSCLIIEYVAKDGKYTREWTKIDLEEVDYYEIF
nr:MAG TPA: hypothetical protein [Caudoviricetes sp.]